MTDRLFGMETEYGFAVRGTDGKRGARGRDWCDHLFTLATQCLPNLPAMDAGGIFLPSGARFYIDCGHPEMTTPECANPWDVVRYMQAGERLLGLAAVELKKSDHSIGEVLLFKTNVDHGGSGATWGCHTSFLHRADPMVLPAQIIPHLVSRIIFTGAGGIESTLQGLRFTVSPRVAFLQREVSGNSTNERGIFHTKDEPLSAVGFHRLHIICGESVCSEIALWLNMGVTALIVAMIEMGLRPGAAVQLASPLAAMRRFAADPTCTAKVPLLDKRTFTAVEIQRYYLELAERHVNHPLMPSWASRVCAEWRAMLDRLEKNAPASVATTLDWAIKLCLFQSRAEQRGLTWGDPQAGFALPQSNEEDGAQGPLRPVSKSLHGLHQELCEIDTRFGQVGDHGIFAALNRTGALAHHVAGVENIEHAMENPPTTGRARLRGDCVRRFAKQNRRYACSWSGVYDREQNRLLDLSEPFATEEKWQQLPRGSSGPSSDMREWQAPVC